MRLATLALRGLRHHRAANVAVVLGVATAVAVLGGALLVGESLRGSLRDQVVQRLGRVEHAVVSPGFFRAGLASELAGVTAASALTLPAVVDAPDGGRRAGAVDVWGVDASFWALQGRPPVALGSREVLLSEALARELGVVAGGSVLVRVRADEDVSGASLFGRRDDPARSLRLTVRDVVGSGEIGGFSLRASGHPVKAAFVTLDMLQRTLGRAGRANTLLIADHPGDLATLQAALAERAQLDDLGLRLRALPDRIVLQADGAYVGDDVTRAAARTGLGVGSRSLVHLANTLRVGDRSIPYSTIAGVETGGAAGPGATPPIVLNEWAAEQLGARVGDEVAVEYFVWLEAGRMETRSATFRVHRIAPLQPADRELVPRFPGLTEAAHMADWEPPFPVDLARIRPVDEAYWDEHRATPKAFVPLDVAQRLFGGRDGNVTSVSLQAASPGAALPDAGVVAAALKRGLDVAEHGLRVDPVRARGLEASRGSTDFGLYFLYFSAFLVAAALLLAGLFFRLGVDERLMEIGLLRAVGYPAATVRRVFLLEALTTSTLGAALGVALAPAWASLLLWALRRFAADTLGTGGLTLHPGPMPLVAGGLGGLAAALLAASVTLRSLRLASPRALLKGDRLEHTRTPSTRRRAVGLLLLAVAAALVASAPWIGSTPAFFGAGLLALAGLVVLVRHQLGRGPLPGTRSFLDPLHLGLRGPSSRPGRSAACVTLVASATFMVVAVGAFRHGTGEDAAPDSAGGGFALLATSLVPIHHDPMTPEGRAALSLPEGALDGARLHRLRMRQGDDASCLNLYAPQSPTVLAPSPEFLRAGRFRFQSSLATTAEEKQNPWLLLERPAENGIVAAIADAGSLQYILKKKLGDTLVLADTGVTVRFVGALSPGLFQGEILVGEDAFRAAFPRESGHRFFLVETHDRARVTAALESALGDFGFDATPVRERLAAYHAVENTYIATFQMLGALGLLLGTIGVAAVMVRNALEQRRELALLSAVGFRRRDLGRMLAAETALVLALGLGVGTAAAALAVLPALAERDGTVPVTGVLLLLAAVVAAGLVATRAAVAAVTRLPLLQNLRSE